MEATGLAGALGVSAPMVSKLLRGDANATNESMVKVASALESPCPESPPPLEASWPSAPSHAANRKDLPLLVIPMAAKRMA